MGVLTSRLWHSKGPAIGRCLTGRAARALGLQARAGGTDRLKLTVKKTGEKLGQWLLNRTVGHLNKPASNRMNLESQTEVMLGEGGTGKYQRILGSV